MYLHPLQQIKQTQIIFIMSTNKSLIINFPNDQSRIDFVGKLDRLWAVEGNDLEDYSALHSSQRSIRYQLPDSCLIGEVKETDLFNYFYNGVPFGKTFAEHHGWG